MVIQVDQEMCLGCGVCVDVCPEEAISIAGQWAVIDDSLCTACKACIETCPNGAISAITEPVHSEPIMIRPEPFPGLAAVQQSSAMVKTALPVPGVKPAVVAALAYLGREVTPHLVDLLMNSIERKLAQPKISTISPSIPSSMDHMQRRYQRKQIRRRGKRMGLRKQY
jgi:Fe-S-cluster-containing hydrogenase component 2